MRVASTSRATPNSQTAPRRHTERQAGADQFCARCGTTIASRPCTLPCMRLVPTIPAKTVLPQWPPSSLTIQGHKSPMRPIYSRFIERLWKKSDRVLIVRFDTPFWLTPPNSLFFMQLKRDSKCTLAFNPPKPIGHQKALAKHCSRPLTALDLTFAYQV